MNESMRKVKLVFLTAIYCLALGIGSKSYAQTDFQKHSNTQEKAFSSLVTKLFCPSAQLEISTVHFTDLPPNKGVFLTGQFDHKTIEQRIGSTFTQYLHLERNFRTKNRKFTFFFPFHDFW